MISDKDLKEEDFLVFDAIRKERIRQDDHIELIASENYVSKAVLEAQGSIMTNKYAEGYPGHRYYGGCEYVDIVENLARDRIKRLFNCEYANVQPHSGSQANMAVFRTLLNHGDRVLGMKLDAGGHLSHGSALSFSGQDYQVFSYGLDPKTERLNYDEILKYAKEVQPKMIIAGASAYPRIIDFKEFRHIADEVGAYLFVDMAHIAGLIAAGLHPSPIPYAHVVSSTTHKTLRGPRGGLILANDLELGKSIDKNVFPGVQGGPLMHVIAAKAVAFEEALKPDFKDYQKQIVKNADVLAKTLVSKGYHLVSGGTDNHLMLVDVKSHANITGKKAQDVLGKCNITVNKNSIPNDTEKPFITSGIRLGTPACTTRGFVEEDMVEVANIIDLCLTNSDDEEKLDEAKQRALKLTRKYPLPY